MSKRTVRENASDITYAAAVVLVHTTDSSIVRALENAHMTTIGSESFLQGTLISPTPGHFDDGKMVRLNIRHIISITEFDSVDQFTTRKKGELRLIPDSPPKKR